MDKNLLSPYIRLAINSVISPPCTINKRILYDYEIIFVKDGKCRININGKDFICKQNNVVFLRPGIPHSFHIETESFVQPHIHFDAAYSKNSVKTPISFKTKENMNDEEKSLIQPDIFSDVDIPYVFTPVNLSAFQKCFFDIINTYAQNKDISVELKYKMLKLLNIIISQFEQDESHFASNIFFYIKSYIDQNYQEIITLDFLSDMFHINKFTLMRNFKNLFGINVIKYYNNRRAKSAEYMLEFTNLSVREIGESLSFSDAYSFSRFFKSCKGISPKNYRDNLKNLC